MAHSVTNISAGHTADSHAPAIRLEELTRLLEGAEEFGVETQVIIARHARALVSSSQASIPLVDYFRIERDIARALDDLTAHLSTRKLTYKTGDFVLQQIERSSSLVEAISSLADYFNMMHGGSYNTVQLGSKTITLTIDDRDFPYSIREDSALVELIGECVQIKVHCLLDSISEGLAARALQRVAIVRRATHAGSNHLEFWPRPPLLGRETYCLTYDLNMARQSIPRPQALDLSADGIFNRVIDHLESTGLAHRDRRIAERAAELIEDGYWQQEDVAARLSISVATLRRRLSEEGTSFREMVQGNRLKRAEAMLVNGQTVRQVTEALDYSDIRAFNRAFKRWKGTTPAAFVKDDADKA